MLTTNYTHEDDLKVNPYGKVKVEAFDVWASSHEAGRAAIFYDPKGLYDE